MPHKQPRVRVERGLYKAGATYYACAVPPGEKRPRWKSLGKINLTRARDLRDRFVAEVRSGQVAALRPGPASRFDRVASEWLASQERLVLVDELRSQTFASYEIAVRVHLTPFFRERLVTAVTGDDLVRWQARQRELGASPWSIKARWTPLRLILSYAVRHGYAPTNPG